MLCKPQIAFLRESILSILGIEPPPLFYIGGSDVLPPPLEREAESAALAALENGDEAARSLLIEHNLRLVVFISKHFENTGVNIEDLISIGTIGLIKAVNTFNSAKNINSCRLHCNHREDKNDNTRYSNSDGFECSAKERLIRPVFLLYIRYLKESVEGFMQFFVRNFRNLSVC